jgi:5-methylthioadenosine/S-adenosylhomocysteine deaminase
MNFRSLRFIPRSILFLAFYISPTCSQTPSAKEKVDLLVTGGTVVTMNEGRTILDDGALAIKGDSIVAVGARSDIEAKYSAADTLNASGKLILPGFINGHTHVPMTLFRGLHDDVTLDDWLRKYIFPAEAKNVTEEFVRWGTRLAAAEQIRAGVTTYADMYYYEDAVAEETKAAGMRGVLGETFIDFPAPDNKNEAAMLTYTEAFLKIGHLIRLSRASLHLPRVLKRLSNHHRLVPQVSAPILIPFLKRKRWDDSRNRTACLPCGISTKSECLAPTWSRLTASSSTPPTARLSPTATWVACTIPRAT